MQGGGYDSIRRNWENKPFVLAAFLCQSSAAVITLWYFVQLDENNNLAVKDNVHEAHRKENNLTSRNFRCSGENSESLSTGIKKKKCINCDNPDIGKIAEDQLKWWRCRILQKLIIFWYHIEPSGTFWLFTFFSRLLFEYPRMKTPVASGKMFRFIICPPFSATIFKLCKSSSKC
jgi:hypothetical protein